MNDLGMLCPVCSGKKRKLLITIDKWRIEQCQRCTVGILDPMPESDELKKFYEADYFQSQYNNLGEPRGSAAFKRRISQELHRVKFFRRFKRKGSVLDLGCGLGYFMFTCRQFNYDVRGADVSDANASYVRDELHLPLDIGSIQELDYGKASFDVITMWHFLEHVPDPHDCLQRAMYWLKPDGLIVIDVPNYQGTDARHAWKDWTGWQIPFHLLHFSPRALYTLLDMHDLKVIRKKDYHSEYVKRRLRKIPVVGLIARPIAKFFSGTSLAVVTKRRS
jgi:2-polyprenyl-3-methyl-5-hydroxy-6-metoxy-1,4-benzoquinol methylase